ncbi:MAG: DUF4476 domain-containing protein [Ferruginibacter sp.]
MRKLFFLVIMSFPFILAAQQKVGNLTIFSEDGDKFFLILNGEKQHNVAQANLRIEELPQPYYNARIIFADSTIAPISKNNLLIADAEGTMMDVTYKIRKDKTRKARLNYFSAIAVQQDYIPPAGVYVHHYGMPAEMQVSSGNIKTTTTTTTNDVAAVSVSVSGINMNIVVADPYNTSTTTTTGTYSSSNNNSSYKSGSGCNGWSMNSRDFAAALKTIGNSNFEESKLTTAKSISTKNCLSSDQVVKICNLFSFEESKLVFAKHAYKHVTDQKNYFKVNDVFSFDSSKGELSKFVAGE